MVTVALGGGFGGKPRPAVIVQSDAFETVDTIVVALFTSDLSDAAPVRPRFQPTRGNGLREVSDLMVDVIVTGRRSKIGEMVGRLGLDEMTRVDRALLTFLGLAG